MVRSQCSNVNRQRVLILSLAVLGLLPEEGLFPELRSASSKTARIVLVMLACSPVVSVLVEMEVPTNEMFDPYKSQG